MVPPKPGTRLFARTGLVAAVLVLFMAATACGKEDDKEPSSACGLIDADLITELADDRDWHDVGKLYRDGKFTDGCEVVVSGQPLLIVTLIDFDREEQAASAKQTLTTQRENSERTCPETTQPPLTEDSVTAACLSEQKLDYDEWNPRRLVRLTIDQTPGVTLSTDDAAGIMEDLNQRADKLDK